MADPMIGSAPPSANGTFDLAPASWSAVAGQWGDTAFPPSTQPLPLAHHIECRLTTPAGKVMIRIRNGSVKFLIIFAPAPTVSRYSPPASIPSGTIPLRPAHDLRTF